VKASFLALVFAGFPVVVLAGVQIPTPSQEQTFSYEDKDWGVSSTSTPIGPPFGKPTPTAIPGARVIRTLELKALLESDKKSVVVIDVLDTKTRNSVPGAFWMPGAGDSRFYSAQWQEDIRPWLQMHALVAHESGHTVSQENYNQLLGDPLRMACGAPRLLATLGYEKGGFEPRLASLAG